MVSLIVSLNGEVHKLSNKRSSTPLWQKYDIVVPLNSENVTKVAKVAKNFDILTMTLTTVLKNKEKIIYEFFLSGYGRNHDTVSGNPNQRTLLNAWQALALN